MNQYFIIKGGQPLSGDIDVYGSKNAATPIIAATLLTKESSIIDNIPLIEDVFTMIKILESLGAKITWIDKRKIKIDPSHINVDKIDQKLVKKLRSSVLLISPLCHHSRSFQLSQPGGCLIGARPIDDHIDALGEFGLRVKRSFESYEFYYEKLTPKNVVLNQFSVTATENLLMLASCLSGKTTIKIAAKEPHVLDLVSFLTKMGAKIKSLPDHIFEIEGVKNLHGVKYHKIIPDPIEAATFLIIGIVCRGKITVNNVRIDHLDLVLQKLKAFGAKFEIIPQNTKEHLFKIKTYPALQLEAVAKIQALPYPGIPTDIQSMFGVLATQANGTTMIQDPLYEGRLKYIDELIRMGANAIIADPHRALIMGPTPLYGQEINSFDLRTGACLIGASLLAKGQTKISNIYQVDRGYERIEQRLQKINANIRRVEE